MSRFVAFGFGLTVGVFLAPFAAREVVMLLEAVSGDSEHEEEAPGPALWETRLYERD